MATDASEDGAPVGTGRACAVNPMRLPAWSADESRPRPGEPDGRRVCPQHGLDSGLVGSVAGSDRACVGLRAPPTPASNPAADCGEESLPGTDGRESCDLPDELVAE